MIKQRNDPPGAKVTSGHPELSADNYRFLFNSIDEAFCLCDVIFNDQALAINLLYVDVNAAAIRLSGEDLRGRYSRDLGYTDPALYEFLGRTAQTGISDNMVIYSNRLEKWVHLHAFKYSDQSNRIAIVFRDITERRRREEHSAFLSKFHASASRARTASDMMHSSGLMLSAYFKVMAVAFIEIDESSSKALKINYYMASPEAAQGTAAFDISELLTPDAELACRAGRNAVIPDASWLGDARPPVFNAFGIQSIVFQPFRRDNAWRYLLCLKHNLPRAWHPDELELIADISRNVFNWLDRARAEEAVQKAHERLLQAMNAGNIFSWEIDPGNKTIVASENVESIIGHPASENIDKALEHVHPDDLEITNRALSESFKAGLPFALEYRSINPTSGATQWFNSVGDVILDGTDGKPRLVGITQDITGRKLAEQALRQSEQNYRSRVAELSAVLESMTDAVYIGDINGISLANQPAFDQLGYTSLEQLNRHIGTLADEIQTRDLETGTLIPVKEQAFARALGGERVVQDVKVRHRLTGEDRIVRCAASPIIIEGKVIAAVAVNTDITEHKASEERLRFANARYRIAEEAAKGFVYDWDLNTGIVTRSEAVVLVTGYHRHELSAVSDAWRDLIHPDDRATMKDIPEAAFFSSPEDVSIRNEYRVLHKDGSYRHVHDLALIVYDRSGKAIRVIGQIMDVTERQIAEEALRISEERYRVALNSAEMGAWDWDVKADQVVWNEQHFIMLGISPESDPQSANYLLEFIHPDDVARVSEELTIDAMKTGRFHSAFRIIRADNSETRWMSGFGRAVTMEGDKVLRMVGVLYDITDQKLLEQQKEEFIGIASHELKTPVTSIKAYGEVLESMFEEADDQESAVLMGKLNRQVDRLTALIGDLLDTTRISGGQLALKKEITAIDDLIAETARNMQGIAGNHRIILSLHAAVSVSLDRERIRQVLTNIIANAIKYSPGETEVLITSMVSEGFVTVSVRDYGIGMSDAVQARVFERFYRSPDRRITTFPGLGLGMFISAEIVKRHGGGIWIPPAEGKGSTFSFTLPVS